MGSKPNPNPWSPYDSYNDCSQGICNMYCPQWCYFIFPPPPPSFFFADENSSSSSSSTISPLLIALIGILVSAFILVSYYTLISKFRRRHHSSSSFSSDSPNRDRGGGFFSSSGTETRRGDGLNDSLIKSITVYKYRKGDGFVDCSDCSVCLSEFEEKESLRLLPKCNHAFHLPCIDTWLKSHSNCPLCRAYVTTTEVNQSSFVHQTATESGTRSQGNAEVSLSTTEHHSVVVVEDQATETSNTDEGAHPKPPEEETTQPIRRSVSLNSGLVVSVADVLREIEDDERGGDSAGVGTSQRQRGEGGGNGKTTEGSERSGVSSLLVKSSVAMKRSVSTGRFIFSRSDRGPRNYRLPN